MKQFGLIGYPLSHSFSKGYFADKFKKEAINDANYEVYPLSTIEEFNSLSIKHTNLAGLNVTIPYKEAILPFLDKLDNAAREVGAVNTIKFIDNKKIGYNTDIYGFEKSFIPLLQPHHRQALILGTGGASKAVAYVFKQLGISFQYVTRQSITNNAIPYQQLTEKHIEEHTIIINTTPLGMYPNLNVCPKLPYKNITNYHICYDLIYNPEETLFLQKAKQQGATTKNGLEMLYLQAEKSWQIWNTK